MVNSKCLPQKLAWRLIKVRMLNDDADFFRVAIATMVWFWEEALISADCCDDMLYWANAIIKNPQVMVENCDVGCPMHDSNRGRSRLAASI